MELWVGTYSLLQTISETGQQLANYNFERLPAASDVEMLTTLAPAYTYSGPEISSIPSWSQTIQLFL